MKLEKRVAGAIISTACAISMSISVCADNSVVNFTVAEDTSPVLNPHKGWVQYSYSPWYLESEEYGESNNPSWNLTDTVYCRFFWSDIETAEGVYDWSLVDEMIEQCEKSGRKFAFGIIPSDSGCGIENGLVPQYVYDKGCGYVDCPVTKEDSTASYQKTPVWSDEIYIDSALSLAKAVADRYDGNDTIEYIDVRSLGNWGEWHTFGLEGSEMPDDETQKYILDCWNEYFNTTTLVLPVNYSEPTDVSRYAAQIGITLRRDGLLGFEDCELALSPAFENGLPCVGEFAYGYQYMKPNNLWSEEALIKAIRNGHITYMAMGKDVPDGMVMYNENKELIDKVQNIIGYNFVVEDAELSENGDKYVLSFTVKNTGSAAQNFDMYFKAAFTDEYGNVVEQIGDKALVPAATFEAGMSQKYSIEIDSNQIKDGNYISLGIFENETDNTPSVRFANENTQENNYLLLGKITLPSTQSPADSDSSSDKATSSEKSTNNVTTSNPNTGMSGFALAALLVSSTAVMVVMKKNRSAKK